MRTNWPVVSPCSTAYAKPPPIVLTVMSAVMILLGEETSWLSVKKNLSDPNFLLRLKKYDKDKIGSSLIKKMKKFTKSAEFNYDSVKSKSMSLSIFGLFGLPGS